MTFAGLPTLRESLDAAGLSARRGLGQHFLLDLNLTRKIVRLAGVGPGEAVVEVGPGPGGLTRALLEAGAHVVAIEKDARFLPILQELASRSEGRLQVIHADALETEPARLPPHPKIVANLPYNIATPLLVGWLTGPLHPCEMTLMFQKEVADRLVAAPGRKTYGRLSVLTQVLAEPEILMELPARAFTPPPKVTSAVIRLVPRANPPLPARVERLERITAAAFGQRRKMLRSSLKDVGGEDLCRRAGVSAAARAEALSPADYLALADSFGEGPARS